jgi:hypothetical protein
MSHDSWLANKNSDRKNHTVTSICIGYVRSLVLRTNNLENSTYTITASHNTISSN